MPRKKTPAAEATSDAPATAVAEANADHASVATVPEWIDGPAGAETGSPTNPEAKNWGNPYKAIVSCPSKGFEMGEHRRFKQRVFLFKEKPSAEILAALKDAGFIYRANEKAWTIPANPDTRKLSDELAQKFRGEASVMER